MKISTFLKPLSFIPALALMYMIYTFSGQTGDVSSTTSYEVSHAAVETVNNVTRQGWDTWQIDSYAYQINGIVRKTAHVTEYFLLAVAVSFPLYVYGVRGILLMLLAGAICVGYAFGDEYHQSMVAGRSASTRDVAIDSIGIFFGIVLTRLIGWSGRMAITGPAYERRQNRREKELDERESELIRREDEILRRESIQHNEARRYSETRTYGEQQYSEPRTYGEQQRYSGSRTYNSSQRDSEYRRQLYERGSMLNEAPADDDTSDELSDDLPLSGLFNHHQRERS